MKSARRFETEKSESLKSFSKHNGQKYYSESFPTVASKRCYVAYSDLDFEGIGNLSFQQLLQRLINLSPCENKVFR